MTGPEVTVTLQTPGSSAARFGNTNIGLSFEASDLANRRWAPTQSNLNELVAALDRPALRFGGNSIDRRVFWTSRNEPAPDWASTTLRPADLDRLARFIRATQATVTLSVDLGHHDPQRAADFAFHARQALGDALVGIAIGNEPNGFNLASQPELRIRDDTWGTDAYLTEATAYVDAILARTPDVPLIGPGAYDGMWLQAFAGASLPNTTALTQHWYPLWSCDTPDEPHVTPTVDNLVSPWLHERTAHILGTGLAHARNAQLPLWLEETGPTSCPGTNPTSRTHAQALWTVDYLLHAAQLGVERAALHSSLAPCDGGPPTSIVCTRPGDSDDTALGGVVAQPGWLALYFLAQARSGTITSATVTGSDRTYAYTIADATGTDLIIVDLRDPTAAGSSPLRVEGPPGSRVLAVSQLAGTDLGARDQTTLVPLSPVGEAASRSAQGRPDAVSTPLAVPGLSSLNPATATLIRIEPPAAAANRP